MNKEHTEITEQQIIESFKVKEPKELDRDLKRDEFFENRIIDWYDNLNCPPVAGFNPYK